MDQSMFKAIMNFHSGSKSASDTYNCYYICQFITSEVLDALSRTQLNSKKGCDIIDFVRVLANVIPHGETDNLFVVMGLIDLFREIKQSQQTQRECIRLKDITDFVCEKYKLIYKDHETKGSKIEFPTAKSKAYAIDISYDHNNKRLVVATQKDIRFVDVNSGRQQVMFNSIFDDRDDDVTVFKTINYTQQAIIGNQRGDLQLHDLATGEKLASLIGHANDVSLIQIDYSNKIILTGGYDCCIQSQVLNGHKFEMKRRITNFNYKKIVTLMELSVHHNLLITCTDGPLIYVWDYEFNRMLASLVLDQGSTAMSLCFLNGLSMLFISTTDGHVYSLFFDKNETIITFKIIGMINVEESLTLVNQTKEQRKMWLFNQQQSYVPPSGPVRRTSQLHKSGTQNIKEEQILKQLLKSSATFISPPELNPQKSVEVANQRTKKRIIANQILCDCSIATPDDGSIKIEQCTLYLAVSKGQIATFNLASFLNNLIGQKVLTYTPHSNKRSNYNPYRNSDDDFAEAVSKTKTPLFSIAELKEQNEGSWLSRSTPFSLTQSMPFSYSQRSIRLERLEVLIHSLIKAHSKKISILSLVHMDSNIIVTTSPDGHIKLWEAISLNVPNPLGVLNLQHNKSKFWKLRINDYDLYQKKILFALKTIEVILNKYSNEMQKDEAKVISVNKLFEVLFATKIPVIETKHHNLSQLRHKLNKTIANQEHPKKPIIIVENSELQRLIELSDKHEVVQEDPESLQHFLSPNYRQKLIRSSIEPIQSEGNTNSSYQRLVKIFSKLDKQSTLKEPPKKPKSKIVCQTQIKLSSVAGHKFTSIASLNMKDSDSEPSQDPQQSEDTDQSSKQMMGRTTCSNFYDYASQKKLISTSKTQFSPFSADKKAFGEVMENLRTQKMQAQQGRILNKPYNTITKLLTPGVIRKQQAYQSSPLEIKIDKSHQMAKTRVASMLTDLKASVYRLVIINQITDNFQRNGE